MDLNSKNQNHEDSDVPTEIQINIPILNIVFFSIVPIIMLTNILSIPFWNAFCLWTICPIYGRCILRCLSHTIRVLREPSKTFHFKIIGKIIYLLVRLITDIVNVLIFKSLVLSIYYSRGFILTIYFLILIALILGNALVMFLSDSLISTKAFGSVNDYNKNKEL